MKRVELGTTGVIVSRVAVGTGTHGWAGASDQTRKGSRWLSDVLLDGLQLGVTFWDLADQYGSHPHAATALQRVERGSVQILTKTTAVGYSECRNDLARFLKELGTDRIDVVLLHAVASGTWVEERSGAMKALSEAKASGTVGAVGVSCHSLAALKASSTEPWVEAILARLNYRGDDMDAEPEAVVPVLRRARAQGKGLIAMKVFGCGSLTGDPGRALEYVLGLGIMDAVTAGPTDDDHLRQAASFVERFDSGPVSHKRA